MGSDPMSAWKYPPRRAKYGNKKVIFDGETFDSKKEAQRFAQLKVLERAGAIGCLERQKKYVLIPKQTGSDGKIAEREVAYIADFVYFDRSKCKTVIEDTKGYRTPEYIIKRKLMRYILGYEIDEI